MGGLFLSLSTGAGLYLVLLLHRRCDLQSEDHKGVGRHNPGPSTFSVFGRLKDHVGSRSYTLNVRHVDGAEWSREGWLHSVCGRVDTASVPRCACIGG